MRTKYSQKKEFLYEVIGSFFIVFPPMLSPSRVTNDPKQSPQPVGKLGKSIIKLIVLFSDFLVI